MANEYVNGYLFGSTETVTSGKLNQQFTLGYLQNVARGNFDSSTRPVTNIAALSSTSLIGGELQYLNTVDELHMRNSTEAAWSVLPQMRYLTNKSGGSVARGDVIVIDTTTLKSFTTTTTANKVGIIGIALDTIASNAAGPVQFTGYVPVNVNASTAIGDFLTTSTTVKKADNSATFPTNGNVFAMAVTTHATQVMAVLVGGVFNDFANVNANIAKEQDPRQRRYVSDDFFSGDNTGTSTIMFRADHPYTISCTGAANFQANPSAQAGKSVMMLSVGANVAHMFLGTATSAASMPTPFHSTYANFRLRARFASGTAGAGPVNIGVVEPTIAGTASHGMFFDSPAVGSAVVAYVASGGTYGTMTTGVTLGTAHHDYELKRIGTNVTSLVVDGSTLGTITAAISGTGLGLRAYAINNDLYWDYWQVSFDS